MNTYSRTFWPPGGLRPSPLAALRRLSAGLRAGFFLAMLGLLWAGAPAALADESPIGCTGSALGINLFTSTRDVHIGDTITYSVTVFNGLPGSPRVACDATGIQASLVTPDGVSHDLTSLLVRRTLMNQQNDFYPDIVSYVVRAQDVLPDGTVRATAKDTGVIHQNDTDSKGGGDQGVNTEVSLPCIQIGVQCVGAIGENGMLAFTGSVTNCGNNTLVGVTITNFVNGGQFHVTVITNLLKGAVATFSGTWIPANPCVPSTITVVAQGVDQFTSLPRTVTASASTTCSEVLNPAIKVTKVCPVGPVSPGQVLVFTGTVTNTGDVTLKDVVVVSDQPANTTVFTIASLAPGAGASFFGSYVAPVDCSTTSGVTARGTSVCGVLVTSTASSTCAIVTTPLISVTTACSPTIAVPGGVQTYTGTVRNTGDIPLKNVVVVSDRPVAGTTLFTVASLAPGASAAFTGTYTVPLLDACAVTTTVVATGRDLCTDKAVTSTSAVSCGVTTVPQVAVTLECPATAVATGGLVTYTGIVSNPGNVTLKNVTVTGSQTSPKIVLTVLSLAPGASVPFTASFTAPADACSVSTTVTASGADACSAVVVNAIRSATCTLLTKPLLAITQTCPAVTAAPGGLLTYTGTIRNAGDITLTNVVVLNGRSGVVPVFTAASLAPGASAVFTGSYIVPVDVCSVSSTSVATATSTCGIAVTTAVTSVCPVLGTPSIVVTTVCSTNVVSPGGPLSYGGTVRNSGNITLNNVSVTSDRPVAGTVLFTVATLAPGASAAFTGAYTAPASFPAGACAVTATVSATGKDACSDKVVASSAAASCAITTLPQVAVTLDCPAVTVATGAPITYTGTVSNPGNVTLNNVTVVDNQSSPKVVFSVASLAPGVSANFTARFTAPADSCSVSTTVTASGSDNCTSTLVTASKSATCTLLTVPGIVLTQACPVGPTVSGGLFTYTGTVRNSGNVTLTNVVVTEPRSVPTNTSWFDDSLPAGAVAAADGGDAWTWVTSDPAPFSGASAHRSELNPELHQHYFTLASPTFTVDAGDILVQYVYLDPAHIPSEIMLQWNDGNFDHRAYWGDNLIGYGQDGTDSRRRIGAMPPAGQWVRLEVPASAVGLEGRPINGMAFSLFGGRATWDATGKTGRATTTAATVFTAALLAPGASADFTGSFALPAAGGCSVTFSLAVTASDRCTGTKVSANSTGTCPVVTSPAIEVTQTCPVAPVRPGGLLTYTGTVRNIGDITLTNVVVSNDRSGAAPVLTLASLAPGASATFTGSYVTHADCCVDSSTVTARGQGCAGEIVRDTATRTCAMLTSPKIEVTKVCAPGELRAGDRLTYTGTVRNTGDITLINVEVVNDRPGSTPLLGRLTLAPGEFANYRASYIVPLDFCGTDTVTATGADVCTSALVTHRVTVTCPVITEPAISITKRCPTAATPRGGLFTYTGTVKNIGTVTLLNVIVVNSQPVAGTPVIGPITLAPGASVDFSGSYIAPSDCCETTDTLLVCAVDRCTGALIKATATQVCPLLTTPRLSVTEVCPATPVPVGGLFTFGGSVTNTGDVNLTNVMVFSTRPGGIRVKVLGPVELAPGEAAQFNGSYVVPTGGNPATDLIEATGMDTCRGRLVTASSNCSGPVRAASATPVITSIVHGDGTAKITWISTSGTVYRIQCKAAPDEPIWTDVPGDVTAAGVSATKDDVVGPTPRRFYRVTVLSE